MGKLLTSKRRIISIFAPSTREGGGIRFQLQFILKLYLNLLIFMIYKMIIKHGFPKNLSTPRIPA